jgi:hypothetical protein
MALESETAADDRPRRSWPLGLLFTAEVLALALVFSPYERFSRFAYGDSGAELAVHDLIARGYRPTVDFGYIYGLLPLLIGRVWYALLGATPTAFRLLTIVCAAATAWGLARFASALRFGVAGLALIVLAMPDSMLSLHVTLVQALEPALLVHALAEQAAGRRSRAMALVTACVFIKPSMAYLYGLILVGLIARGPGGRRSLLGSLVLASATGLILAALLAAVFGISPLAHSLIPGAGAEVYRQSGYGFFRGSGRDFWWRPGVGIRGYLRYEVGYWLAGTLVLSVGGIAALVRLSRGGWAAKDSRRCEIIATCAILHVVFVTIFFGNRFSWIYYLWVLIAGLAALSTWGRAGVGAAWLLALLLLLSDRSRLQDARKGWAEDSRGPDTYNLWATNSERDEWRKVLSLTSGTHPVLLAGKEGVGVIDPRFARPVGSYFVPGHPVATEIERKAAQLGKAEMVVRVRTGFEPAWGGYERWPEIAAELAAFEPVWTGTEFEVLTRVRPATGSKE